jgi:aspartate/methionine/tyrosine aminotransferase
MMPNSYSVSLDRLPSTDRVDLTETNPSRCGFAYPQELTRILAGPGILDYRPDPRGLLEARRALARHLTVSGKVVEPEDILLTAGTSEGYSHIFRLMADPGQAVHYPMPGYPLIEYLVRLDSLRAVPYRLRGEVGWPIDRGRFEASLSRDSRVLVDIRPHNPTGTWQDPSTTAWMLERCAEHDMAFVSDEVFLDYSYDLPPEPIRDPRVLSFRLGGLSKTMGLPGWKLSWIVMEGPEDVLAEARERLEFVADAYLSVGTPVQTALGEILAFAPIIRSMVLERVKGNRKSLENSAIIGLGWRVWQAQGGWMALIEAPPGDDHDEGIAEMLLERASLAVHPGSLYGLDPGRFLVISLLPPPEIFRMGLERLAETLGSIRRTGAP